MVAELKPAALTRRDVVTLVANYVRQGMTAQTAAAQVIADVRGLGQQEALIDAIGAEALVLLWRGDAVKPVEAIRPKIVPPTPASAVPLQRRVNLEALYGNASLVEGMYQIDGTWRRIGDFDKAGCRAAAQWFKSQALENAHNARYFHALAQALNGGETVRQRFDDDGLMRLWKIAGQSA